MQRLDAINETSYLSVPNAPIYRKIMRVFYREYEKMHFQLYKEDVYELVKGEEEFAEMIQVQRAYNLNSNAFTVINEMTSTAIDLKS